MFIILVYCINGINIHTITSRNEEYWYFKRWHDSVSPQCQFFTSGPWRMRMELKQKRCILKQIIQSLHCSSGFGEKPILSFETRSRIVFFQSRASRRERDFVHRISSLETRSRILFTESRALRRDREVCSSNLEIRDEIEIFRSFYQNIFLSQKKRCFP